MHIYFYLECLSNQNWLFIHSKSHSLADNNSGQLILQLQQGDGAEREERGIEMKAKVKKVMNVRKVEPSTSCKDTSNFQDYKLHDVNPGARLGPYSA